MTTVRIMWPSWKYHATEPARIFATQAEVDAAGPGWVDHPDQIVKEVRPPESDDRRDAGTVSATIATDADASVSVATPPRRGRGRPKKREP